MSFQRSLRGFRRVETRRGDTLQAVALRELGDASGWPDLAAINGLIPPYIVDNLSDFVPGVLIAGQLLTVPAPAAPASGVAGTEDVLGSDMQLAAGLLQADAGGDFAIVSGGANLAQAIQNRLSTRPGELVFHPRYGCKVFDLLGGGAGPVTGQLAATYVDSACRSDPRVATTAGTVATVTGDAIQTQTTAISVDGKRLPIGATTSATRAQG